MNNRKKTIADMKSNKELIKRINKKYLLNEKKTSCCFFVQRTIHLKLNHQFAAIVRHGCIINDLTSLARVTNDA